MTDVMDDGSTSETLDLSDVRIALNQLLTLVDELDGTETNIEGGSRAVSREKAAINRKLLYAEHLADLARVAMMCHYHHFKGERPRFQVMMGNKK